MEKRSDAARYLVIRLAILLLSLGILLHIRKALAGSNIENRVCRYPGAHLGYLYAFLELLLFPEQHSIVIQEVGIVRHIRQALRKVL